MHQKFVYPLVINLSQVLLIYFHEQEFCKAHYAIPLNTTTRRQFKDKLTWLFNVLKQIRLIKYFILSQNSALTPTKMYRFFALPSAVHYCFLNIPPRKNHFYLSSIRTEYANADGGIHVRVKFCTIKKVGPLFEYF